MLTQASVRRITTDFSLTRNKPTASHDVSDDESSRHALDDLMRQCGATMFYSRKAEIYTENATANHLQSHQWRRLHLQISERRSTTDRRILLTW